MPEMGALEQLGGMPSEARVSKALAEAAANIQLALADVYTRSAKASKHLSVSYEEIQKAREVLDELSSSAVGPPPDMMGNMQPSPMGQPSPMF